MVFSKQTIGRPAGAQHKKKSFVDTRNDATMPVISLMCSVFTQMLAVFVSLSLSLMTHKTIS